MCTIILRSERVQQLKLTSRCYQQYRSDILQKTHALIYHLCFMYEYGLLRCSSSCSNVAKGDVQRQEEAAPENRLAVARDSKSKKEGHFNFVSHYHEEQKQKQRLQSNSSLADSPVCCYSAEVSFAASTSIQSPLTVTKLNYTRINIPTVLELTIVALLVPERHPSVVHPRHRELFPLEDNACRAEPGPHLPWRLEQCMTTAPEACEQSFNRFT